VLAPHAAENDTQARFPRESVDALAAQGFLGLTVPAEHGGSGEGPAAFAAVAEELAMHCGSTAMIYVMHIVATQAIVSSTHLAARAAVLREITSGAHLTTLAFSEARALSWALRRRWWSEMAAGDAARPGDRRTTRTLRRERATAGRL
jgi:alkylation response protein AidB-like acyl-CoA dehydrogenase